MRLVIDAIVLFVAPVIEKNDATVVKVESDARTSVVLNGMPGRPIAPYTLNDDDGLLVAVSIELLKSFLLFYLNAG